MTLDEAKTILQDDLLALFLEKGGKRAPKTKRRKKEAKKGGALEIAGGGRIRDLLKRAEVRVRAFAERNSELIVVPTEMLAERGVFNVPVPDVFEEIEAWWNEARRRRKRIPGNVPRQEWIRCMISFEVRCAVVEEYGQVPKQIDQSARFEDKPPTFLRAGRLDFRWTDEFVRSH